MNTNENNMSHSLYIYIPGKYNTKYYEYWYSEWWINKGRWDWNWWWYRYWGSIYSIKSPQSDTPSTDSDEKLSRKWINWTINRSHHTKKGQNPNLNVLFPELAKIGTKKYLSRCKDKQEYFEEDVGRLKPRIGRYLNRTGVDGLFTRYKTGRPSCYKGKKEKVERRRHNREGCQKARNKN